MQTLQSPIASRRPSTPFWRYRLSTIAASGAACRPVLRRRQGDLGRRGSDALPPVELINFAQSKAFEEGAVAKTRDEVRRVRALKAQQCFDVEMIVMIMCDEDYVNGRQVLKGKSRLANASGP